MAIKTSQFFSRYRTSTLTVFVLLQFVAISLVGTAGWLLLEQQWTLLETFVAVVALLLLLELIIAAIFIHTATTPLRLLSQAIAHVSDDPVQTPPPTVNSPRFERSGLKALIQTVYQLAAQPQPKEAALPPASDSAAAIIFANAPCGIVALNAEGQVLLANNLAPTHKNPDESIELELLFEQSNSLDQWLIDCRANKVRDTKMWRRIADSIPGEDGRRIFDVIAYYNKEGEQSVETILLTIDRTADYTPADEDMDFIALAAHELRGPITVIRGYLDLLDEELKPALADDQQVLLDRLQVSAEQLSGYINNILNVSRYDRNLLSLHLHEEPLIDIIKDLVPDLALRAKTKRRRLSFHLPPDLPTVAADRSSLSEVLSNLIDNAIKYSREEGEIVVRAAAKGNFVEVTVQDSGVGIPGAVIGSLFTKFYRSHRSRQQVSGTGLGLYICKAIVESHGGSIWVRSKEGQGSTFGFTVPIYSTVADKLKDGDNSNQQIIERAEGWIKNHAMYRR